MTQNKISSKVASRASKSLLLATSLFWVLLCSGCSLTLNERVEVAAVDLIAQAGLDMSDGPAGSEKSIAIVIFSDQGRSKLSGHNMAKIWEMLDQHFITKEDFTSVSPQVVQAALEQTEIEQKDLHSSQGRKAFLGALYEADQRPHYFLIVKASQQRKNQPGFSIYDLLLTLELVRASDSARLSKSTLTIDQ